MPDEKKEVTAETIDNLSDAEVEEFKKGITEEKPEPEQKAKAEPDAEDDDDDTPPETKEKQETVPFGKFHRVNVRRQQAEERAAAAEKASTVAMQRLSELLEAQKPKPQQEEWQDPDPEPDPSNIQEHYAWNVRRVKAMETFLRTKAEDEHRQSEGERQVTQVLNAQESHFTAKTRERPELQDAANYLVRSIAGEIAAAGYQGMLEDGNVVPGSQVAQATVQRVKEIALWCYQNRVPIDQYYERSAKARGWRPPTQEEMEQRQLPDRNANGQFVKAETERIDRQEQTRQKAKSLGGSGTPVEMSQITPEALVNMSDEDFAAFKAKHGENAMRKAFGAST